MANDPESMPSCFIAMPMTTRSEHLTRYGGDDDHWEHVMEGLFIPCIRNAGFEPILPEAEGADVIQARIVEQLVEADLVLVDYSSHNPNVFFELGVRTSLNRPVALVHDEHTDRPFDVSGINSLAYSSELRTWDHEEEVAALTNHLIASYKGSDGQNTLWVKFGLNIKAAQAPDRDESPRDAKIDLIGDEVRDMRKLLTQLVDDRTRRGRDADSPKPSYETPAMGYQADVNRYARREHLNASVEVQSPTSVRVVFDGGPRTLDVNRLETLADQHGVTVEFASGGGGGGGGCI